MKGYRGTILRIDLSSGKVTKEELPISLIERWIGGKGFGIYLNYRENLMLKDALEPQNKIFIVTGPGAGTSIPTATRAGFFSRAPLNNLVIDSYLGGSFGHFMKRAGYDIITIEGKADRPVYIKIINEKISIEDASHLWGLDIYATESALKESVGSKARVLSIGRAGENLVRYACIGHDRNRHFGRMGSGAVMGSKLLKAIALMGNGEVEVYDPEGLKSYVRELNRRIKENPVTGKVYPMAGTVNFVAKANDLGVFGSHYWQRGEAKRTDRIDFEYMRKTTLVRNTRCFGCPIACAHINAVKEGPYAGTEIDGPEFETIYAFGGLCDVEDIRDIIKLNDLCDRLGVDTMHMGNLLGLLMYATERGRIPDVYRIKFGDVERMILFIEKIVDRGGEWFILGEGIRAFASRFGLDDIAIHVKGLEPGGYDPRGVQSMAITYGVGNRGATHNSSNSYARDISGIAREHELEGDDRRVDRFTLNRKAELVFNMINFNAIAECFIYCRFLNRDLLTWEDYAEALYLLTGMSKSKEELKGIANDIITLGRWYNIKNGLTMKDDLLPERFYNEPNVSRQSGGTTVSREDYLRELRRYYSYRRWSEDGIPLYMPE
ncbi:MAG: aldehyde ferredoxin oxidoreductase family protein [Spirochaetota bacterium]